MKLESNVPHAMEPRREWFLGRKGLALVLGGLIVAMVAISCSSVTRVVVVPPQIPGAKFVGSAACAQCHENITKDFVTATHARLQARGPNAINMGCESCHGPGSLHVETAGERKTPINYRPGSPKVASGSQRATIINPRRSSENCFECHLDKRGQFNLPYHHLVPEGKISCGDCHDPHKGPNADRLYSNTRPCARDAPPATILTVRSTPLCWSRATKPSASNATSSARPPRVS